MLPADTVLCFLPIYPVTLPSFPHHSLPLQSDHLPPSREWAVLTPASASPDNLFLSLSKYYVNFSALVPPHPSTVLLLLSSENHSVHKDLLICASDYVCFLLKAGITSCIFYIPCSTYTSAEHYAGDMIDRLIWPCPPATWSPVLFPD